MSNSGFVTRPKNAKEIDDAHAELAKATKDKLQIQLEMMQIIQGDKKPPTVEDLEAKLREDILELLNSNDEEMEDLGLQYWNKSFPGEPKPNLKVGGKRRKRRSQKRRSQKKRSQKKRSKKR